MFKQEDVYLILDTGIVKSKEMEEIIQQAQDKLQEKTTTDGNIDARDVAAIFTQVKEEVRKSHLLQIGCIVMYYALSDIHSL